MAAHTFCRLCEGYCGFVAETDGATLTRLEPDSADPVSEGYTCEVASRSLAALRRPDRVTRPLKRENGRLVPATWDEAIKDIGQRLGAIRSQSGARAIGLHLGEPVQRSSRVLVRSLAFALGMGTPNVFSSLASGAGPRLFATELMLGHPVPLLADVGRAHYVVMMGQDPRATSWGPGYLGMAHEGAMQFSRKTKGTKVVVADPRKTELAAAMDQHLAIRPGTEPFLALGMLAATVKGDWRDRQYVEDYTRHYEKLGDLLAPWPVDRCADICGVTAAALSGVALKFGRAAMAVLHAGPSAFQNANGMLGAWAWLALHTLTANTLRPGGLYEHVGFVDPHNLLTTIGLSDAPRTRVHGHPLQLLQAPETSLVDEVLTPGEGQVRALISVSGDAAGRLPGSARVKQALGSLELLVCLAREQDETTAAAHWVLPIPHPWERADLGLHDNNQLPVHGLLSTPAVVSAPGEVRAEEDILKDLFAAVHPGLRGSAWGAHLGLFGGWLARADLESWENRLLGFVAEDASARLAEPPHRIHVGDTDRSQWRVTTKDGRIDLLPDAIGELLARLEAPVRSPDRPFVLRTSAARDRAPDRAHRDAGADPGVSLHPDAGFAAGSRVRVVTRYGEALATVRLDPSLRADTVDLPAGYAADALALLPSEPADALAGAPVRDGLDCAIRPA